MTTAESIKRGIRQVQRALAATRPFDQEDRDICWRILQETLAEVEALELEAQPEVEEMLV